MRYRTFVLATATPWAPTEVAPRKAHGRTPVHRTLAPHEQHLSHDPMVVSSPAQEFLDSRMSGMALKICQIFGASGKAARSSQSPQLPCKTRVRSRIGDRALVGAQVTAREIFTPRFNGLNGADSSIQQVAGHGTRKFFRCHLIEESSPRDRDRAMRDCGSARRWHASTPTAHELFY